MILGQQQFLAMQDGRILGRVIVDPFHVARREIDDSGRPKRGKRVVEEMLVGQERNPLACGIDFYDVKVSFWTEAGLCHCKLHSFTEKRIERLKNTDVEVQVSLDSFP
jgi:hypothetical protein